jgi:hypothetical protein
VAVQLTPDQIAIVNPQRKSADDLPEYYNATLKTDVPISRDFEAFLILSTNDLKTSALSWIEKAVDLNQTSKLRDALTALASQKESSNAGLKITAYNAKLQDFSDFRENFQSDDEFSAVPEVQQFIQDLQAVIDELTVGLDRATFDQTAANVSQTLDDQVSISQDQVEELQSWTSVISAYLTS